ncbi:HAD fAmily hydrolase fragment [Nautilia profundicola AmH]|uniref:HAD fAmily hydrolase n=1 Tax=Nautilia profundicola (strain ATCC BAA-1463 / DSM 18972 / AmH) TaxID=598659 RepID=B9L5Z3_NAUPA|nr:HAD family hydrolase [Nautilia profundicola]ACM92646.1 HAD fAmily hydrolase fragment [Nautilia profundicola AmH]
MKLEIQNIGELVIKHIVLDYNGTIAKDGIVKESVKRYIKELQSEFDIYVITSDTHGSAAKNLEDTGVKLKILTTSNHTKEKEEFVKELGFVFAVGNGSNDSLMLKAAELGICVIENEGASVKSVINADIVCKTIEDAFELLIKPKRIIATLRQ